MSGNISCSVSAQRVNNILNTTHLQKYSFARSQQFVFGPVTQAAAHLVHLLDTQMY